MRITKMMTMILSTGGRENFLIVRFLRDALDCIWSAVNRITVDQHDGQLHPFDQHHLHHQHHVTSARNTFGATSWSWLGILLLTCQRGKSRNYLRGFVTFLDVRERCWHIVFLDNRTVMLESNTISYWTGHYEWSSGTKKLLGWHKASVDFRCILFHCSYSLGEFSVI